MRRAIVLLEANSFCVGKLFLEVEDVADVRAAPLVDRLVFVADDADILGPLSYETDQSKLELVCVLILVNENVAKLVVVLVPDVVDVAQQPHGLN